MTLMVGMSASDDLKQAILHAIDDDLYDAEVLPHHGLVPDWYLRYMKLKDLVEEYLDEEVTLHPHQLPMPKYTFEK